jgi:hypothetical protein
MAPGAIDPPPTGFHSPLEGQAELGLEKWLRQIPRRHHAPVVNDQYPASRRCGMGNWLGQEKPRESQTRPERYLVVGLINARPRSTVWPVILAVNTRHHERELMVSDGASSTGQQE